MIYKLEYFSFVYPIYRVSFCSHSSPFHCANSNNKSSPLPFRALRMFQVQVVFSCGAVRVSDSYALWLEWGLLRSIPRGIVMKVFSSVSVEPRICQKHFLITTRQKHESHKLCSTLNDQNSGIFSPTSNQIKHWYSKSSETFTRISWNLKILFICEY